MKLEDFKAGLDDYIVALSQHEQRPNTTDKYRRDIEAFIRYLQEHNFPEADKNAYIKYKDYLVKIGRKNSSINSYIAAINRYFRHLDMHKCCVDSFRVQKNAGIENIIEISEYYKLLEYLKSRKNQTTYMIVRSLASSGMRVSELSFLTVEVLKNAGKMQVTNKNKSRQVLFPDEVVEELFGYCEAKGITSGIIFFGKDPNKGLHRSAIWNRLKTAAKNAEVDMDKVFPHNLRHLFAKTYLDVNANIGDLADILGHENINTTRIYIRKTTNELKVKLNGMKL